MTLPCKMKHLTTLPAHMCAAIVTSISPWEPAEQTHKKPSNYIFCSNLSRWSRVIYFPLNRPSAFTIEKKRKKKKKKQKRKRRKSRGNRNSSASAEARQAVSFSDRSIYFPQPRKFQRDPRYYRRTVANRSHVFIENSIRSNCISNSISFSRVLVGVPGDLAFPFWHPVFLVRSAERNVAPCTVNVTKNASLRRRGTLENEQRWKKEESR